MNLARAMHDMGDHTGVVEVISHVLELDPHTTDAYLLLAQSLEKMGSFDEAITAYEKVLQQHPDCIDALYNKGVLELESFRLGQAARTFEAVIREKPDYGEAHNNLGISLLAQGRVSAAVASFRAAVEMRPDYVTAHSNALMAQQYDPATDAGSLFQEHRNWAALHDRPRQTFLHNRDPRRPLRIGYVSPDLRSHAVSYFLEPLLRHHRPEQCRVTCYADVKQPDATTARLRSYADQWRNTYGLSEEDFVAQVLRDEIDILVDLAGHTAGHRLTAFGRKPAPIQVSYLGYGNTTGLECMDYRITDEITDPANESSFYTETLVAHPLGFACYAPPPDAPQPAAPPMFEKGCLTFGSFNNLAKISPPVVQLWTRVLQFVPNSKLLLKSPSFNDPEVASYWRGRFQEAGLEQERLELVGRSDTLRDHLDQYRHVDIALDTFPYTGSTTTCEALWMGVPVVTLRGESYVGRMSSSLLQRINAPELIGDSQADYLRIARQLAADADHLVEYRNGLRQRMGQSTICDAPAYTHALEELYRNMWKRWCISASR